MIKRHTTAYLGKIEPINLCGKPIMYQVEMDFYEPPFEVEPTHGEHDFNTCNGCQQKLKIMGEWFQSRFNGSNEKQGFPFCCEQHANLVKMKEFNRESFLAVPAMTARKIIYTQQHIINNHNANDWYKIITDYIVWVVESFGSMPQNCGEPLYLSNYLDNVVDIFDQFEDISQEKRKKLLEFINSLKNPKQSQTDFNVLVGAYEKWLKAFPFELESYFGKVKTYFETHLPLFYGDDDTNMYSNKSFTKVRTKSSLIEYLTNVTGMLLEKINGAELYKKGLISDATKLQIEILNKERKLKEYNNNSPNENHRFRAMIKAWLKDEEQYLKKLSQLLKDVPRQKIIMNNANTEENMNKGLIENVKNETLSNCWVNNKSGQFQYYSNESLGFFYKFKETSLDCTKYLSLDPDTFPIIACGFIAFYIHNWHKDKPAAEYYTEYYTGLLNEYKKQEAPSPSSIGRNLENEFFVKHEAEERLKIQQSQGIFDYLTEKDKTTINDHIEAYLKYIQMFNTVKKEGKEKESADKLQRQIDVKELSKYFKPTFKGMGNGSINYLDIMIDELKTERTAKEFAQIALMIFNSQHLNDRKPPTFENWYKIFCSCIGCEKKTYQPKDLRSPKDSLIKLFNYL